VEFMGTRFYRIPTLLRGVIWHDPAQSKITVSAYLTWSHTLIVMWLLVLPLIGAYSSGPQTALCSSVPLAVYSLAAVFLYRNQVSRFRNLGRRWAALWSGNDRELPPAA